jgi:uncharacterized RDD family membrane protein YckC
MAWYYVLNGSSQGPVEASELQNLRQQNVLTADTMVWTQGMAEWAPFERSALVAPPVPAAAGVVPGAVQTCAECGRAFPEEEMLKYENSWVCPACKPMFFQRIREGVAPRGAFTYATVGRRFVAIFVDGLIMIAVIFVPVMIMTFMMASSMRASGGQELPGWFMPIMLVVEYGVPAAYEIFFIGRYGATPGKMLMKIRVVSADGSPISYGRATGRYFAKMLSALILYIGFIMAFWDEEKRALHDRICETRVIVPPQA